MILPQYRQFVECDLEWECVASSLPQLALKVACEVLYEESDIIGDNDVQQAASIFVKKMEEVDLKFCIDVWETHNGFPIIQAFSLFIVYYLSIYHMEHYLHEQAKNIPASL